MLIAFLKDLTERCQSSLDILLHVAKTSLDVKIVSEQESGRYGSGWLYHVNAPFIFASGRTTVDVRGESSTGLFVADLLWTCKQVRAWSLDLQRPRRVAINSHGHVSDAFSENIVDINEYMRKHQRIDVSVEFGDDPSVRYICVTSGHRGSLFLVITYAELVLTAATPMGSSDNVVVEPHDSAVVTL